MDKKGSSFAPGRVLFIPELPSNAGGRANWLKKIFNFSRYGFAGSLSELQIQAVADFALKQNATFILAEFGHLGLASWPIAKRTGLPLFVYFRGTDVNVGVGLWHLRVAYRTMSKRLCGAIFVSQALRSKMLAIGADITNSVVIPSGFDDEAFNYSTERRQERILFVGRMVSGKRPLEVLAGYLKLRESRPNAELIMIGDGPLISRARDMVVSAGVEAQVQLLGDTTHEIVSEVMSTATLLVQYSDPQLGQEGFPSVIQEAMGNGCPMLVTLAGGVGEVINEQRAFISSGDPNCLHTEIDCALRHPQELRQKAKAAYLYARDRFSSTAVLEQTRKFIETALVTPNGQ